MSIDRVREYFRQRNMEDRVLEFAVSSATVELAAQAAGVIPARIAKSLTFMLPDGPIIIVAAGDARIDNPRFKAKYHTKARMLTAEEVSERIGHNVGGVCPFAIRDDVKVYLDESMKRFKTVYPACGSSNSAIELTPEQLEQVSQNFQGWVDVCKGWREEEWLFTET